jgi:hypothetical protein
VIFGPASPLRVQVNDRCCAPLAYWSRDRATWGSWLAWESMATPACCRICDLVRLAVSAAKSASRIRERAAEMFSDTFCRLEMVDSNRFWTAPRPERTASILAMALSMTERAELAPSWVVRSTLETLESSAGSGQRYHQLKPCRFANRSSCTGDSEVGGRFNQHTSANLSCVKRHCRLSVTSIANVLPVSSSVLDSGLKVAPSATVCLSFKADVVAVRIRQNDGWCCRRHRWP